MTHTTNAQFAKTDEVFLEACRLADTKPTARQASKYRKEKGSAHKTKDQAKKNTKEAK
jgi:hypothetical protein